MSASESADEPVVGSLARTISRNVAALMSERGVSQHQLAAAIGLPQTSVGKRLRGAVHWTADDIEAVSIAFDVPVGRLFEPVPEAPSRPLVSVGHVGRRRRPHLHARVTDSYHVRYVRLRPVDDRDTSRIRCDRDSGDLPIPMRNARASSSRCRRVAA